MLLMGSSPNLTFHMLIDFDSDFDSTPGPLSRLRATLTPTPHPWCIPFNQTFQATFNILYFLYFAIEPIHAYGNHNTARLKARVTGYGPRTVGCCGNALCTGAPPARPITYAWEGKISDLLGVRDQTRDLAWNWRKGALPLCCSGFHVLN